MIIIFLMVLKLNNVKRLQGRVRFPTGGKQIKFASPRAARQIWCNSKADSTVWMQEDKVALYVFVCHV